MDVTAPKFFGFSEYLAGLALMILAWTIADIRYQFRVKAAPLPLREVTFGIVVTLGVLTLLTDLWRAEGWLIPEGKTLTPALWQAILGLLFFLTFTIWTWFAFISPPTFSKRNTKHYAITLYKTILNGSPEELAVAADELKSSIKNIIQYATDHGELKLRKNAELERKSKAITIAESYANDLLLLIADKKFCRAMLVTAPGTVLTIFNEIAATRKYGIQIETFARNFVTEAIYNKDSFLFHETDGYESGLLGYHKPLSQAIFSNYRMVETIGSLFDLDELNQHKWDSDQWEAYSRITLMCFQDYVEKGMVSHSYSIYRAIGHIGNAASDLYKENGSTNFEMSSESTKKMSVIINFIQKSIEILDKKNPASKFEPKLRTKPISWQKNFHDHLAEMIFNVIYTASTVTTPSDKCWVIQHNLVWSRLFNFNQLNGPAGKIVKFKARRLIYNEIVEMKQFPNFKGASILGFCLNVMGLTLNNDSYDRDSRALHKATLSWTKKHFAWLHSYNHNVADACLLDGTTYDAENLKIIKIYPAKNLRRHPVEIVLSLDPIQVS